MENDSGTIELGELETIANGNCRVQVTVTQGDKEIKFTLEKSPNGPAKSWDLSYKTRSSAIGALAWPEIGKIIRLVMLKYPPEKIEKKK